MGRDIEKSESKLRRAEKIMVNAGIVTRSMFIDTESIYKTCMPSFKGEIYVRDTRRDRCQRHCIELLS